MDAHSPASQHIRQLFLSRSPSGSRSTISAITHGVVLDGISLLRVATGKAHRQYIDLEHDVCYDPSNHWNALSDGQWKYIYHARDGEQQLFHLAADPLEKQDLAGDVAHQSKLRLWRSRMLDHLAVRGQPFVNGANLAVRPESYLYSPHFPGRKV